MRQSVNIRCPSQKVKIVGQTKDIGHKGKDIHCCVAAGEGETNPHHCGGGPSGEGLTSVLVWFMSGGLAC